MGFKVGQKVYYFRHPHYRRFSSEEGYWVAAIVIKVGKKTVDLRYRDGINDDSYQEFEARRVRLKSVLNALPAGYPWHVNVKDYYD